MTETEWLDCYEPIQMLEFLRGKTSDRKLRLLAVAAVRRILDLVTTNKVDRHLVEEATNVVERFADELASNDDLDSARADVEDALANTSWVMWAGSACGATLDMTARDAGYAMARSVIEKAADAAGLGCSYRARVNARGASDSDRAAASLQGKTEGARAERREQTLLLRELIGNPLVHVLVPLAWLVWNDNTVIRIAETIYDDRAFDRLPILADALEDAGCDNADILTHCRSGGKHVRGCWVVDLLLGKE